jgi:hypothetical protein
MLKTLVFYSQIIKEYLGEDFLGYAEAYSYLVAIVAAYPYAYIANNMPYGQDLVIQFGSLSFMLTGNHLMVLWTGNVINPSINLSY